VHRHAIERKRLGNLERRHSLLNYPLRLLFFIHVDSLRVRNFGHAGDKMWRWSTDNRASDGRIPATEHFAKLFKAGKVPGTIRIDILCDLKQWPWIYRVQFIWPLNKLNDNWQEEAKAKPDARASFVDDLPWAGCGFGETGAGSRANKEPGNLNSGAFCPVSGLEPDLDGSQLSTDLDTGDESALSSDDRSSDLDSDCFWEWDQNLQKWKHRDIETGEWVMCPDSLD